MNRRFTRRGVMIGAGASAASLLAISEASGAAPLVVPYVDKSMKDRVALTAFGDLELPDIFLGGERAIARTRMINCQIYLSSSGRLSIDHVTYDAEQSFVQLSPEQHAELLAAFTRLAVGPIYEMPFYEPVQPQERRS